MICDLNPIMALIKEYCFSFFLKIYTNKFIFTVTIIYPKGGGKTATYVVPSLMKPGISLVVSPLLMLMEDQVYILKQSKF